MLQEQELTKHQSLQADSGAILTITVPTYRDFFRFSEAFVVFFDEEIFKSQHWHAKKHVFFVVFFAATYVILLGLVYERPPLMLYYCFPFIPANCFGLGIYIKNKWLHSMP